MAADSHVTPLATSRIHHQNNENLPTIKPNSIKQPRSSKYLVYILAAIVILSIGMLILGSTLFRINSPDVKLRPVEIKNLHYGTAKSPSLNMTMVVELTIDNVNFGLFRFHNSNTSVLYGNVTVGFTNINSGCVKAKDTKLITISVPVRANKLLNNTNFSSDIGSGILPLSSYTKLRGEVQAIKIINRRRIAVMNCTMRLNFTSQAFQDLRCR